MLTQDGFEDMDQNGREDLDEADLGASISASAMGAGVLDQLLGEIEPSKAPANFLGMIDDRVRYLLAAHSDPDAAIRVRGAEMRFYGEVAGALARNTGAGPDGLDLDATVPAIYKRKVRAMYNFLVIHRYRNVVGLYYAYVMSHRKELAKELKITSDRKDPTVSGMRKSLRNFDDVAILYHVPNIIDEAAGSVMTMDEFVDLLAVSDGDSVDMYLSIDCMKGLNMNQPFRFYVSPVLTGDLRASLEGDLAVRLNASFERR